MKLDATCIMHVFLYTIFSHFVNVPYEVCLYLVQFLRYSMSNHNGVFFKSGLGSFEVIGSHR